MNRWSRVLLFLLVPLVLTGCAAGGAASKTEEVRSADLSETPEKGSGAGTNVEAETEADAANETETDAAVWTKIDAALWTENDAAIRTEADAAIRTKTDAAVGTEQKKDPGPETSQQVDLDLTALSSTMVYSEVLYLITEPEENIGKTVRMDGTCSCFYDDDADVYYYACLIKDATACCSQGIEFVLTDDYACPDDYPEIGEEICVEGTFATYRDGRNLFCTLKNARLI